MLVFYDSGIGGLSIVRAWQKHFNPKNSSSTDTPNQTKPLYLADSLIFPLGEKTKPQAQRELTNSLEQKFQNLQSNFQNGHLVLACNSASSLDLNPNISLKIINIIDTTLNHLQANFNPKTTQPLVLCTTLTKNSGYLESGLKKIGISNFQILDTPLAKLIENPNSNQNQNLNLITHELQRLKNQITPNFQPNLVLLACTHYSFVAPQIESVFNLPTLKQDLIMANHLISENIFPAFPNLTDLDFLATGKKPTLSPQIADFLGTSILELF